MSVVLANIKYHIRSLVRAKRWMVVEVEMVFVQASTSIRQARPSDLIGIDLLDGDGRARSSGPAWRTWSPDYAVRFGDWGEPKPIRGWIDLRKWYPPLSWTRSYIVTERCSEFIATPRFGGKHASSSLLTSFFAL